MRGAALLATRLTGLALGLAGCASPVPPPSNVELPFEQAIGAASDNLALQARRLPAFQGGAAPAVTVSEPVIDAATGQQTAATAQVDRRLVQRLGGTIAASPVDAATASKARFVLTGTLARTAADRPRGTVLLNLALTDVATGTVVAQSWALAQGDGVDATPLPCEADAPMRLRDPAVEALVTTSATGAGRPAQGLVVERLPVAAPTAEADRLCNAGQPAEAFAQYRRAAAERGGGDAPRVLNGLYVTSSRLGRTAEAEQAFDRLVAAGLAGRQFELKFLFKPGSTVLAQDARYPVWLRRLARASAAAKVCLEIVGHSGNMASPKAAEALSLQRAAFIRQRLVGEASVLGGRTRAIGAGSGQALVGNGTDNAVDALDRRIEFKVVGCG